LTGPETYAILGLRSKRSDPLQGSGGLLGLLSKFFCPQQVILERSFTIPSPAVSDFSEKSRNLGLTVVKAASNLGRFP
jgi:hypothetical protein